MNFRFFCLIEWKQEKEDKRASMEDVRARIVKEDEGGGCRS